MSTSYQSARAHNAKVPSEANLGPTLWKKSQSIKGYRLSSRVHRRFVQIGKKIFVQGETNANTGILLQRNEQDGDPTCIQKPGQLLSILTHTGTTISFRSSTRSSMLPSINGSPRHQKIHGKIHPPSGTTNPVGARCGMTIFLVVMTIKITQAIK